MQCFSLSQESHSLQKRSQWKVRGRTCSTVGVIRLHRDNTCASFPSQHQCRSSSSIRDAKKAFFYAWNYLLSWYSRFARSNVAGVQFILGIYPIKCYVQGAPHLEMDHTFDLSIEYLNSHCENEFEGHVGAFSSAF